MSTATVTVALAAQPADAEAHGKQVLEVFAAVNGRDPVNVLLRTAINSRAAEALKPRQAGDILVVTGDLFLEDDQAVLYVRTSCDVPKDCYVNEVCLVGRIAGKVRVAESNKSAARSLAINRKVQGEEVTDWFKVRGYGYMMERLTDAPSGSLVLVTGSLDQRTNRDGNPYCEIKGRTIRTFKRGGGSSGGGNGPVPGSKASGYDHEDFANAIDDMPFEWSN